MIASSGSTTNPYRYGGKYGYYTETYTGLVLATQRWYLPNMMRWISRDPIGYEGGVNLFEYVGGRPIYSIDPTGHEALTIGGGIGLVGGGSAVVTGPGIATAGAGLAMGGLLYCAISPEACESVLVGCGLLKEKAFPEPQKPEYCSKLRRRLEEECSRKPDPVSKQKCLNKALVAFRQCMKSIASN